MTTNDELRAEAERYAVAMGWTDEDRERYRAAVERSVAEFKRADEAWRSFAARYEPGANTRHQTTFAAGWNARDAEVAELKHERDALTRQREEWRTEAERLSKLRLECVAHHVDPRP